MQYNLPIGDRVVSVPPVIIGCMRFADKSAAELNAFLHTALELKLNFFDHADIYGDGACEQLFGEVLSKDRSLRREDLILQSKCGIKKGLYDLSRDNILRSVDGILRRLKTDYLDVFLLHRPDALVEPEEVAEAFDRLSASGKVLAFGVANHKPSQIELLKKYTGHRLVINQLQFSIPVSNMVASGMEVNMETAGAADRDGSVLDYCRLHDITIQAWSPFQKPAWRGPFLGAEEYGALNDTLGELAAQYETTPTAIAAAWILRHPAQMQIIAGTTNADRLREIASATAIALPREAWYRLYLSAGHILP